MHKEQLEHISIIMEIVAFFFVTLDLYGKGRLSALRNNIIKRAETVRDNNNTSVKRRRAIAVLFSASMVIINGFFIWVNCTKTSGNYQSEVVREFSKALSTSTFLVSFILIIGIVFFYVVITLSAYRVLLFLIAILLQLLRVFRIEGIMLTFGAALFVVAKLMLYFSV